MTLLWISSVRFEFTVKLPITCFLKFGLLLRLILLLNKSEFNAMVKIKNYLQLLEIQFHAWYIRMMLNFCETQCISVGMTRSLHEKSLSSRIVEVWIPKFNHAFHTALSNENIMAFQDVLSGNKSCFSNKNEWLPYAGQTCYMGEAKWIFLSDNLIISHTAWSWNNLHFMWIWKKLVSL